MKRFISIILAITLLLSVNLCCMAEEPITFTSLPQIDDLELYFGNDASCTITTSNPGSLNDSDLTANDIAYIISFFENSKLECVNPFIDVGSTDYTALIDSSCSYNIQLRSATTNLEYYFLFDKSNIVVGAIDASQAPIFKVRHGLYKFKNENTYNELSSFIDNLMATKADDSLEKRLEEYKQLNSILVYNFKILYNATLHYKLTHGTADFNWGICSYVREGESTSVTKIFYGPINTDEIKWLEINGQLDSATNTVSFELISGLDRRLILEKRIPMHEQDSDSKYAYNYSLQINVTDEMEVEKIFLTKTGDKTTNTYDIYPDSIIEEGKIPEGFFSSENNVNYVKEPEKTDIETPKDETPAKPETEEKQETVVEDKPEVEPEKEEVKPEEEKNITEDKKENTTDDEKSDDTDTDLKEETIPLFFSDVPENHWAYDEIYDFAKRKIVLGYGNGLFGVDDSITYEHFALLLERQLNYNETNRQNSPAIREDVIVSIVKALKIDVSSAKEGIIDNTFTDCKNLKPENRKYIAAAIEKGLVIGSDAKLCPHDNLTRAETVILLSRAENYR